MSSRSRNSSTRARPSPSTGYAKRGGHRQLLTLLEIEDVSLGGGPKTEKKAAKKPAKPAAKGAELAESEVAETTPDAVADEAAAAE